MAAAFIPLIASAAPGIIDLITSLVHKAAPAAEQQLGAGTGPVKFAQVFGDVMGKLQAAAAAGQIDKTLPADNVVQLIIQTAVTSMKLGGQLGSPASAGIDAQAVALSAGQTLTITVK